MTQDRSSNYVKPLLKTRHELTPTLANSLKAFSDAEQTLITALEEEEQQLRSGSEDTNTVIVETLQRRMRERLRQITSVKAGSTQDILAKLQLWQELMIPEPECSSDLGPTDLLVLSCLHDLQQLQDNNGEF